MLKRYLEDLEKRIDETCEGQLLKEWADFCMGAYQGTVFSPVRSNPQPPGIAWPEIPINDTLEDTDTMILHQLAGCSSTIAASKGNIPCVRPNYGTGTVPSLFGVKPFIMDQELNTLPTNKPLEGGEAAIEELVLKGLPDTSSGLGGRAFAFAERFRKVTQAYPRVSRFIHLYHPDFQGPMDICELLWGSGIFYSLVDKPDLVKSLLGLITETYVKLMKEWEQLVSWENGRAIHWNMMHKGHIMLRDDSAMNLSPVMFKEFIRPYDQRLLDEFGGGAIHFCGKGDHYIDIIGQMERVYAVNLAQPEYNHMETIYRHTVDKGINLIGLTAATAAESVHNGRDLRGRVHGW